MTKYKRLKPYVWTWKSELWLRLRTDGLMLSVLVVLMFACWTLVNWAGQRNVALITAGLVLIPLLITTAQEAYTDLDLRNGTDRSFALAMTVLALGASALVGALVAVVAAGLQAALPATIILVERVRSLQARAWMMPVVAVVTVATGAAFFWFRLRQRFLYGCTEAMAGAVIAAHRLSTQPGTGLPSEGDFYIAVLTAGVYLVVRGLDNMHQAMKANDGVFVWVQRRLLLWHTAAAAGGKSAS